MTVVRPPLPGPVAAAPFDGFSTSLGGFAGYA